MKTKKKISSKKINLIRMSLSLPLSFLSFYLLETFLSYDVTESTNWIVGIGIVAVISLILKPIINIFYTTEDS